VKGFFRKRISSLHDELSDSARKILLACGRTTMTFWIDQKADIHGDVPEQVPPAAENFLLGTYGLGTSIDDIEEDLRAERRERARSWIHW
jgi:hypothetical protein